MGQAIAAGAPSVAEPANQFYGDRLARITDAYGNHRPIATHIEDLTPDEIAQRLAILGGGLSISKPEVKIGTRPDPSEDNSSHLSIATRERTSPTKRCRRPKACANIH